MKKGFTLIELLAVIIILGIIALIAIPVVNNIIKDSKRGAAKVTAESIITAYDQQYQIALLTEDNAKATLLASSTGLDGTSGTAVKTALNVKGDLPDTITTLHFDSDNNVLVEFTTSDNITCTNVSTTDHVVECK